MVKRESGVNPEQTRCCEFLKLLTNNATVFYGKAVRVKQVRRPARSVLVLLFSGHRMSKPPLLRFSCVSFHTCQVLRSVATHAVFHQDT